MSKANPIQPPPAKSRKPVAPEHPNGTLELNEVALGVLVEKIGQVVREAVREELAEARSPAARVKEPPKPSDLPQTGVDLRRGEPAKAVKVKEEIRKHAIERQGLIDTKRFAAMLSISRSSLWSLHTGGALPMPVRLGRSLRWREIEVLAWLEGGCPTAERWEMVRKRAVQDYEMARRSR